MNEPRRFGDIIKDNLATNTYPYNEDQLNLVEEREEIVNSTVYAMDDPRRFSLVLDPSIIMESYEKLDLADKPLFVSPKSKKTEHDHLDENENVLDDFDVSIVQKQPKRYDNFKTTVSIHVPKKANGYLQICPPATDSVDCMVEESVDSIMTSPRIRLDPHVSVKRDLDQLSPNIFQGPKTSLQIYPEGVLYLTQSKLTEFDVNAGHNAWQQLIRDIDAKGEVVTPSIYGSQTFCKIVYPPQKLRQTESNLIEEDIEQSQPTGTWPTVDTWTNVESPKGQVISETVQAHEPMMKNGGLLIISGAKTYPDGVSVLHLTKPNLTDEATATNVEGGSSYRSAGASTATTSPTPSDETSEKTAIRYLDSVIGQYDSLKSNQSMSQVGAGTDFDVKFIVKAPEHFRVVVPVFAPRRVEVQ